MYTCQSLSIIFTNLIAMLMKLGKHNFYPPWELRWYTWKEDFDSPPLFAFVRYLEATATSKSSSHSQFHSNCFPWWSIPQSKPTSAATIFYAPLGNTPLRVTRAMDWCAPCWFICRGEMKTRMYLRSLNVGHQFGNRKVSKRGEQQRSYIILCHKEQTQQ